MELNEIDQKLIDKAEFFRCNEIKCHISTIPKGTFKNGLVVSDLQHGKFFWFIDVRNGILERLFLKEIWEIEEYKERGDEV